MTTLIEELVMPYGVTVQGDGTSYPKIVGDHPNKVTPSGLSLLPVPCRVAFSWAGENSVELSLVNGDTIKIPARLAAKPGGGPRSAMVTIGALAGDRVELNVQSAAGETGTIEVYPIPATDYSEGVA